MWPRPPPRRPGGPAPRPGLSRRPAAVAPAPSLNIFDGKRLGNRPGLALPTRGTPRAIAGKGIGHGLGKVYRALKGVHAERPDAGAPQRTSAVYAAAPAQSTARRPRRTRGQPDPRRRRGSAEGARCGRRRTGAAAAGGRLRRRSALSDGRTRPSPRPGGSARRELRRHVRHRRTSPSRPRHGLGNASGQSAGRRGGDAAKSQCRDRAGTQGSHRNQPVGRRGLRRPEEVCPRPHRRGRRREAGPGNRPG